MENRQLQPNLLGLPAEIRMLIYEALFQDLEKKIVLDAMPDFLPVQELGRINQLRSGVEPYGFDITKNDSWPSIFRVSRKIRREALDSGFGIQLTIIREILVTCDRGPDRRLIPRRFWTGTDVAFDWNGDETMFGPGILRDDFRPILPAFIRNIVTKIDLCTPWGLDGSLINRSQFPNLDSVEISVISPFYDGLGTDINERPNCYSGLRNHLFIHVMSGEEDADSVHKGSSDHELYHRAKSLAEDECLLNIAPYETRGYRITMETSICLLNRVQPRPWRTGQSFMVKWDYDTGAVIERSDLKIIARTDGFYTPFSI